MINPNEHKVLKSSSFTSSSKYLERDCLITHKQRFKTTDDGLKQPNLSFTTLYRNDMYRNDFLLILNRGYQCIETTLHRNDRLPHTNFDLAFTSRFLNFKTTFSCSLSGFGAIATAIILEPKCLKKKTQFKHDAYQC